LSHWSAASFAGAGRLSIGVLTVRRICPAAKACEETSAFTVLAAIVAACIATGTTQEALVICTTTLPAHRTGTATNITATTAVHRFTTGAA
jgi:hypothetical protein